jgi:hypothetical protein
MPLIALLLLLLLPLVVIALMPLILMLRYRAGRARRMARPWVATLNVVGLTISALLFLIAAGIMSLWVPMAIQAAAIGLAIGAALGVIGSALSRWEPTAQALYYTPNRWLVLLVTLLVSARLIYSLVRGAGAFDSSLEPSSIVFAGLPASLAAAATVLGYYLWFGIALRWRIGRWQKRRI